MQESRNVQRNQETDSDYRTKASQAVRNADYPEVRTVKSGSREKQNIFSFSRFPFTRKKPCLMEKLAGELDAGQIAEIRLGIEDGLTDGQLAILADKAMDAEKIRELRMTMKILNERGQGT